MDDLVAVQVEQGVHKLIKILRGGPLVEAILLPLQLGVQFTSADILQDLDDALLVREESVHFDDVGVIQVGLDLDLLDDGFLEVLGA